MFDEFEAPKEVQTKTTDSTSSSLASDAYSRDQLNRIEPPVNSSNDSANAVLGTLTLVDGNTTKEQVTANPTETSSFRLDANNLPPLSIVFDASPTFDATPSVLTSDISNAKAVSDSQPASPAVGDAPHPNPQPSDSSPKAKPTDSVQTPNMDSYTGENINRDVPFEKYHEVKAGETLHDVAKNHLGPGASEADIQKHMKEIQVVNGYPPTLKIEPGDVLTLPGHTKDGGYISSTFGHPGTRTVWPDGRVKEEYNDGTGFERTPVPHKGKYAADLDRSFPEFVEKHHGPNPKDNYEIHKAIGEYTIKEPGKEEFHPLPGQDIRYDRAKLNDLAENNIKDPKELATFKRDMEAFEQRAKAAKPPLSEEEIAKSYYEMARLMEAGGDKPLSHDERVKLASQAMHHAANPETIQQGQHDTCNVTTIETRMYTREPSAAIRMVADLGINGEFKTNDGKVVKIDPPDSIKPHDTSKNQANSDDRDYASQVFQVGAVNVYHATHPFKGFDKDGKPIELPPGAVRYVQVEPKDANDTGERLMDYSDPKNPKPVYKEETKTTTDSQGEKTTKTKYVEEHTPSIPVDELTKIYDNISQKNPSDRGVVIENNSENHADPKEMKAEAEKIYNACHIYGNEDDKIFATLKNKTPEQLKEMDSQFRAAHGGTSMYDYLKDQMKRHPDKWAEAEKLLTPKEAPKSTDQVFVKSPEELESKIKELKEQGKLPATIMVDSNNDPFFMDSGGGKAGGSGSWHVVNITDYHPAENGKPARVDIQNQWGDKANHFDRDGKAISINDLYESTYKSGRADQVKRLQKEVKDNKDSGHVDAVKEFQLLRMELANGMITEKEYAQAVGKVMRETDERWKKDGDRTSPDEAKRVREYYRSMLYGLDKNGLKQDATSGVNPYDYDPDYVPDFRDLGKK